MAASLEVGSDHFEQLLGGLRVQRVRMLLRIDQMGAHVVLDDFGHQPGGSSAHSCDQVHHLFAARVSIEGALDGLDLTPDPAHSRQELLLLTDGVRHAENMEYTPTLFKNIDEARRRYTTWLWGDAFSPKN